MEKFKFEKKYEKRFEEFISSHVIPFNKSFLNSKTVRFISDENIMKWSRICFEAGAKSQNK